MKILAEIRKDSVRLIHGNRYAGKINGIVNGIERWGESGEWRIAIENEVESGLYSGFLYVDLIQKGD